MNCQVFSSAEEQETPQAGQAERPQGFCWSLQCASGKGSTVADFWSWLSSWLVIPWSHDPCKSLHWSWGKIAMSASYLYINTHNAAAVPYYALPWGCEETFKEICFDGVVIPNRNLKKEKEIGWSHYNILEWQKVWATSECFSVAGGSACART